MLKQCHRRNEKFTRSKKVDREKCVACNGSVSTPAPLSLILVGRRKGVAAGMKSVRAGIAETMAIDHPRGRATQSEIADE